jgi:hypothetical protein
MTFLCGTANRPKIQVITAASFRDITLTAQFATVDNHGAVTVTIKLTGELLNGLFKERSLTTRLNT